VTNFSYKEFGMKKFGTCQGVDTIETSFEKRGSFFELP
jgi:hypothetical protein